MDENKKNVFLKLIQFTQLLHKDYTIDYIATSVDAVDGVVLMSQSS
jgi:hypothetical protein